MNLNFQCPFSRCPPPTPCSPSVLILESGSVSPGFLFKSPPPILHTQSKMETASPSPRPHLTQPGSLPAPASLQPPSDSVVPQLVQPLDPCTGCSLSWFPAPSFSRLAKCHLLWEALPQTPSIKTQPPSPSLSSSSSLPCSAFLFTRLSPRNYIVDFIPLLPEGQFRRGPDFILFIALSPVLSTQAGIREVLVNICGKSK